WKRHQKTSLETAKELLAQSHAAVMKLIKKYSDQELFTKEYFLWTGNAALGSFFISNTSSHYDWAIKKLKAHKKNCAD
ncbi:MAG: ClbS/DfsB family four-helix bundle protein, partial [Treponema sp.]|nr:ClbS/DfsB family four-helix bundle protein [Treponema sp.]